MTVGLHPVNLTNEWLDMLGGTAFTAPTTTAARLHTGDPGASGVANGSANTTRVAYVWAAASAGAKAISNTPSWSSWASGTETLTHVSSWDSATAGAGNFLFSAQLTASKTVTNGDTFTLSSLSISLSPLAA
jgi:hypothetical protein